MGHPIFLHRIRVFTWWLVWIIMIPGQSLLLYYSFGGNATASITEGVISMMLYSLLALAVWYPLKYFNREGVSRVSVFTNTAAMAILTVILWLLGTEAITYLLLPGEAMYDEFRKTTLSYRAGSGLLICALVVLTYYLIMSQQRLSWRRIEEARLENLLRDTEMKMLRSQINPHFLFNTLNSVSSLTLTNPEAAREMIVRLSDFMRYALSTREQQWTTLEEEMANIRLYLNIEKIRFGERLQIVERKDERCSRVLIPVMLLQPLFENAVKHGVYESLLPVTIETLVSCSDRLTTITIRNNFDKEAIPKKGTGAGLANVRRRLELLFGSEATFSAIKEDSRFTVTLGIPPRGEKII